VCVLMHYHGKALIHEPPFLWAFDSLFDHKGRIYGAQQCVFLKFWNHSNIEKLKYTSLKEIFIVLYFCGFFFPNFKAKQYLYMLLIYICYILDSQLFLTSSSSELCALILCDIIKLPGLLFLLQ
jgi:hypothetical protein